MYVVINIDDKDYEGLKRKDKFNDIFLNYYEKLIVKGTPLSSDATNGDMIKAMFPNAEISYGLNGIVGVKFIHMTVFDLDWWNVPYKTADRSEKDG